MSVLEAEGQKSCHPPRRLSLRPGVSPQARQGACRAQATVSLTSGEFLVNPLILAEHDSLLTPSDHVGCSYRPVSSTHRTVLVWLARFLPLVCLGEL
jgi:hypothetical protein